MTDLFKPSASTLQNANISLDQYNDLYKQSIADPDAFWSKMSKRLQWIKEPTKIKNTDFNGDVSIKWFEDGILNAAHNCIDRHLLTKKDTTALIWESDDPSIDKKITYGELKNEVCRLANALKSLNVKKGDRIIIYMPMIPEATYAMLACARIGAVHSVVFGGFSPKSLQDRIHDCGAKIVITADEGVRGGKTVPLKNNTDEALQTCPDVKHVLVYKRTGGKINWNGLIINETDIRLVHCTFNEILNGLPANPKRSGLLKNEEELENIFELWGKNPNGGLVKKHENLITAAVQAVIEELGPHEYSIRMGVEIEEAKNFMERLISSQNRDIWWHKLVDKQSADCPCEPMNAEDPLFILYTSGSTGKPKGILHTTGGYLLFAAMTHEMVFDYKPGEIYWCTADVGWVTGHSYIVYGPLANGATTLMFEGIPNYPDWSRFWQVIDKHKVNIFYTAPTAIRSLIRAGDDFVKKTSRKTLRILGSVGEPINSEAWLWYYTVVGETRCPIMDTWWQTETGGHLITPLPCHALKPGSASLPFFGIKPEIVDNDGKTLQGEAEGNLCIADSWPGQARTIYGDHERFKQTYFSSFKAKYFTGDGARRDKDNYYWITGRVDDVINVSGHRLGTAEIESAINEHTAVAESAVVGFPHDIKGQGIYAYVTLREGTPSNDDTKKEIIQTVRKIIGPIASPDVIQWAPGLPKTRSGKIMRRILRKIAANELDSLGDTSTLADPAVVDDLVKNRKNN